MKPRGLKLIDSTCVPLRDRRQARLHDSGTGFYSAGTWDMGFRTYVDVPEPSTLALALLGAGLLSYSRKSHRVRT